jgi:hypothetical protein
VTTAQRADRNLNLSAIKDAAQIRHQKAEEKNAAAHTAIAGGNLEQRKAGFAAAQKRRAILDQYAKDRNERGAASGARAQEMMPLRMDEARAKIKYFGGSLGAASGGPVRLNPATGGIAPAAPTAPAGALKDYQMNKAKVPGLRQAFIKKYGYDPGE